MDKSNLAEIRKALRRNEPPVDWIYAFYVTPDNELSWQSFRKFLSFDEDEMFRHKDILKKAVSGSFGRELFSVELGSQAEKLFALRTADEPDEEILEEFAGEIISSYAHTDPYYACLARITYDVPALSTDRRKLEDGDVVFQSLLFTICPASLSKPALGYSDVSGVSVSLRASPNRKTPSLSMFLCKDSVSSSMANSLHSALTLPRNSFRVGDMARRMRPPLFPAHSPPPKNMPSLSARSC